MSIRRKIKTFKGLQPGETLASVEAVILLCAARMLVTLLPHSRWRNEISVVQGNAPHQANLSDVQRQTARMVMHSIERANRNLPAEFVCLPQALSARWMLSRRNIPTELFLGTKPLSQDKRDFHAWLKAGDITITGHCDESAYAVFGSQRRS